MSLETWENIWNINRIQEWDFLSEQIYQTLKKEIKDFRGKRILEAGAGTGRISLRLAMEGAQVTLLDYSQKALDICGEFFKRYNMRAQLVNADLLNPLPFKDQTFDVVWNSGVMEHFTSEQQLEITREFARIGEEFHTFNPYSRSIFYRLGKWTAEQGQIWQYGEENPVSSMESVFKASGFKLQKEYSIAHATSLDFLEFIQEGKRIKDIIGMFLQALEQKDKEELLDSMGGYLLYSKGLKKKRERVLVHTMPFMILKEEDMKMAERCLRSLSECEPSSTLVVYNQGYLTRKQLDKFLKSFNLDFVILGNGKNVGIPAARQCCFEYIWSNIPNADYISEIHVDMIFSKDWAKKITDYLEDNDEPMLTPGILTAYGELHPDGRNIKSVEVPEGYEDILRLLPTLERNEVCEGLVHPVIHRAKVLKEIGGYDIRLLTGKQGYEDDSILLGYMYHMGTRSGWKPKALLSSRVYHISLAQRSHMDNITDEHHKNLHGLINQYGAYGLKHLAEIHGSREFQKLCEDVINGEEL